jgi:hypothetical protein
MATDPRVESRASQPLPEESAAGATDDATAMAEAILEESDERQADRDDDPGADIEHRTSEEATPPSD